MAGRIAVGYALLASLATALSLALTDGTPWLHPRPWWSLEPLAAHAASAGLGLAAGLLLVVTSRAAVARFSWARLLSNELRPFARGLSSAQIAAIASLSSIGEELLFRGLLQPWLGLLPASVLFGALHQVGGPARIVWMTWATAVGLLLGAIFSATGSLLGPIVAHAVVNALNLASLRDSHALGDRST